MRRPVNSPYTITTEFGVPDSYSRFGRHAGVDYAVATGRQVLAPASGQLTNIVSPTGGNMVVIYDGQFYHRLMHNSTFSRGNGWVNEGEEVAKAGTTGLSTGPHVHWDINREGSNPTAFSSFVNPADWLNGAFKQTTPQGGEMANRDQVNALYKAILFREGDPGGLNNYTGRDANQIVSEMLNSQERKNLESNISSKDRTIAELQQALKNEQNKPPKEVIKEVEKIVEKPVIKEAIVEKIVPGEVNEKQVVENVFKRFWNSLFK